MTHSFCFLWLGFNCFDYLMMKINNCGVDCFVSSIFLKRRYLPYLVPVVCIYYLLSVYHTVHTWYDDDVVVILTKNDHHVPDAKVNFFEHPSDTTMANGYFSY